MEAIRITQGRSYVYDSACLHSMRIAGLSTLGHDLITPIRWLGIRGHRCCRAGRSVRARAARRLFRLRSMHKGAYIIMNEQRQYTCRQSRVGECKQRHLLSIKLVRHTHLYGRSLKFGSANMPLLTPMKLDLLMDEFNVRSLDILLLCATWHDSNSIVINCYVHVVMRPLIGQMMGVWL